MILFGKKLDRELKYYQKPYFLILEPIFVTILDDKNFQNECNIWGLMKK